MKGIRKRLKGAFKIEYANALVGRQAAINRGNVGSSLTQGVREPVEINVCRFLRYRE